MAAPLSIDVPAGTRVPLPAGLERWCAACDHVLRRGFVILIDYMAEIAELPTRPWLRTYRENDRGMPPLVAPGMQDITADVVVENVLAATHGFRLSAHTTQALWLRGLGIDDLAEEGARQWREGAHRGDLDALAGRSRVHEAAALTDPAGLGAHHVIVLERE